MVNNDFEIEADELFSVRLSNATNAIITDSTANVTIIDDDTGPALPMLSVSDVSVIEGSYARFILSLSEPATQTVSFFINTVDGSASASTDYSARSGSRSFAPGEDEKTIWIATSDDADVEADETFTLELSAVTNANVSDGTGIGTIINDDVTSGLPSLSIADIIAAEGSTAKIVITLSQAYTQNVSFQIDTVDQSASANLDYSPKSGNRVIAAGETEKTIWIPIAQDSDIEGSETFTLELSNANKAVIADGSGLITIADDDSGTSSVILNVTDTADSEGRFARFIISLSEPATQAVSFMFNTVAGTAEEGSDYTANSGMRTFNPGDVEKSIWVATVDDTLAEADETFTLQISSVSGATLGDGNGNATIINNDTATGVPNLSIADATVLEGSLARCVLTLSAASSQDIRFRIASRDLTATANHGLHTEKR